MKAVRLLPYNHKKGHLLETYISAATHSRYQAGTMHNPSVWKVVESQKEIDELSEISQFEIKEFVSMQALEAHVDKEMDLAIRSGGPPVKARIETVDLSVLDGKSTTEEEDFISTEPKVQVKPPPVVEQRQRRKPGPKRKSF